MPEVQSVQGGSQFNERILFAHRKLRWIAEALLNLGCRLSLRIIPRGACHVVFLAQLVEERVLKADRGAKRVRMSCR